jgi:anti-sigma B factor antagonist
MQFQIQTSADGPIAIATLSGRLDAANSRQLRRQFEGCLRATDRFVFDCQALDFIDSTGLGAVVACLRKALATAGDIRLAGVAPKVKLVFELTQAKKLFTFFTNADQALASFADQQA